MACGALQYVGGAQQIEHAARQHRFVRPEDVRRHNTHLGFGERKVHHAANEEMPSHMLFCLQSVIDAPAQPLPIPKDHPMLTIHHLGVSQSERVVWLCEELGIPYTLKLYTRDAVTRLAPPDLRALHPAGTAPVMDDGDVRIAESGAIVQYIIAKYGAGRLALPPDHAGFAHYLYWFHFANGNLQPHLGRNMVLNRIEAAKGHPAAASAQERVERALAMVEERLGQVPYFAGNEFTAADIMNVFTLTTMRYFQPWDISGYPQLLAYLARIAQRPAYVAAMAKGDPGMKLLLT